MHMMIKEPADSRATLSNFRRFSVLSHYSCPLTFRRSNSMGESVWCRTMGGIRGTVSQQRLKAVFPTLTPYPDSGEDSRSARIMIDIAWHRYKGANHLKHCCPTTRLNQSVNPSSYIFSSTPMWRKIALWLWIS